MNIVPVAERPIKLGDGVHAAISLFKETYGGVLTFDSGHADTPTLIYTFPSYGNAQVATRTTRTNSVCICGQPPVMADRFNQFFARWQKSRKSIPAMAIPRTVCCGKRRHGI